MNRYQTEKMNMYKKMLIFFASFLNKTVWATFKRLTDEIAKFEKLNTPLSNYVRQHHTDIKGITTSKKNAFTTMIILVVKKAKKAYVWAVDTDNDNLAQTFDVQKSDFLKISEYKAYIIVKNIRDTISANIDSMESVKLTVADVKDLNEAIKAYESNIDTAVTAKSQKTEGSIAMEDLLHPMDKNLDLIDNLMVSSYSNSHPDMVKEYFLNQNIDKLPTRQSGVSAVISDAVTGARLKGAMLTINSKTAKSDLEGLAEIIKMKPGIYLGKVSHVNYATQDVWLVIERGKITEIRVKMVK